MSNVILPSSQLWIRRMMMMTLQICKKSGRRQKCIFFQFQSCSGWIRMVVLLQAVLILADYNFRYAGKNCVTKLQVVNHFWLVKRYLATILSFRSNAFLYMRFPMSSFKSFVKLERKINDVRPTMTFNKVFGFNAINH